MFGGARPTLAALIARLASLRTGRWPTPFGSRTAHPELVWCALPARAVQGDGVVDDASLLGDGSVSDMLWATPP